MGIGRFYNDAAPTALRDSAGWDSPFRERIFSCRCRRKARQSLLMLPQPGFRQINVPLDAAQDFVADDALVAELKNRPAFHAERFVRQMFVFG